MPDRLCGYAPHIDCMHPSQKLSLHQLNIWKEKETQKSKNLIRERWTSWELGGTPSASALGADCGLVCKINIPPAISGPINVGLCESKPFRFCTSRKQRLLSGAVVFHACLTEPLTDEFVADIETSGIHNLTWCQKSSSREASVIALSFPSGVLRVQVLPKSPTRSSSRKELTTLLTVACVILTVLSICIRDVPFHWFLMTCSLIYAGTWGGIVTITQDVLKGKPTWATFIYAEQDKCLWTLLQSRISSRLVLRSW